MSDGAPQNVYLTGSLASVYAKTATPIILMMLVNGSFNLVDAYFLGIYVGADALRVRPNFLALLTTLVAGENLGMTVQSLKVLHEQGRASVD